MVTCSARYRFEAKIRKTESCWEWLASRNALSGYGQFRLGNRMVLAHRMAYTLYRGHIPFGKCIDHLCRNRGCVNPEHLEPCSIRENTLRSPIAPSAIAARRTHCNHGHPYSGRNLRLNRDGSRVCRACHRLAFPAKTRRGPYKTRLFHMKEVLY